MDSVAPFCPPFFPCSCNPYKNNSASISCHGREEAPSPLAASCTWCLALRPACQLPCPQFISYIQNLHQFWLSSFMEERERGHNNRGDERARAQRESGKDQRRCLSYAGLAHDRCHSPGGFDEELYAEHRQSHGILLRHIHVPLDASCFFLENQPHVTDCANDRCRWCCLRHLHPLLWNLYKRGELVGPRMCSPVVASVTLCLVRSILTFVSLCRGCL